MTRRESLPALLASALVGACGGTFEPARGADIDGVLAMETGRLTLSAVADTELIERDETNHDARDQLTLRADGAGGSPGGVALLRFELSSGCDPIVTAVVLRVHVRNPSKQPFDIYTANRAWSADQATWTLSSKGARWETPGAKGASDRGPLIQTFAASERGTLSVDLGPKGRTLVETWLRKPAQNHGLLLTHPAHHDGVGLSSSNHPTKGYRPALFVKLA